MKTIAILVAAIILLTSVTGIASTVKIANNSKGIAKDDAIGIVFDFSKTDNRPNNYSKNDNKLVKKLND